MTTFPNACEAFILIRHYASEIADLIRKRGQPVCQCIPEIQQKARQIMHLLDGLELEESQ